MGYKGIWNMHLSLRTATFSPMAERPRQKLKNRENKKYVLLVQTLTQPDVQHTHTQSIVPILDIDIHVRQYVINCNGLSTYSEREKNKKRCIV